MEMRRIRIASRSQADGKKKIKSKWQNFLTGRTLTTASSNEFHLVFMSCAQRQQQEGTRLTILSSNGTPHLSGE